MVKAKSTYFTRCSTYSGSNDKNSGQSELETLKLCMYLKTYFHNVCAKNHPQPTFLRVKVLARHKVVKAKSTNFRRWSTYSASDDNNSSQGELRKMKFCILLVNYFHYVCANFHSNPTTFSVKGLARKKVVKRKSTNFMRCPNFLLPMIQYRVKWSLGSWNFACSYSITTTMCVPKFNQIDQLSGSMG